MKQLVLDISRAADPTLDNFVAGPNREAWEALQALALGRLRERMVYLWGGAGSGRTHLLRGFVHARSLGGEHAVYVSGPVAAGTIDPLPAAVAWDDVHLLDADSQGALFGLYIHMQESGGALLAAGNAPPAQLSLRPDVVTRIAAGLVYQLRPLADEEKAEAVARHAERRGLALGHDVIEYLLRRSRRDLPSLLATLEALDRYSLETKRPVTVPLLRELLAETGA